MFEFRTRKPKCLADEGTSHRRPENKGFFVSVLKGRTLQWDSRCRWRNIHYDTYSSSGSLLSIQLQSIIVVVRSTLGIYNTFLK